MNYVGILKSYISYKKGVEVPFSRIEKGSNIPDTLHYKGGSILLDWVLLLKWVLSNFRVLPEKEYLEIIGNESYRETLRNVDDKTALEIRRVGGLSVWRKKVKDSQVDFIYSHDECDIIAECWNTSKVSYKVLVFCIADSMSKQGLIKKGSRITRKFNGIGGYSYYLDGVKIWDNSITSYGTLFICINDYLEKTDSIKLNNTK